MAKTEGISRSSEEEIGRMDDDDEQLREAKADTQKRWKEAHDAAAGYAQALRKCGLDTGSADSASLPRLNALAQDCLASLRSLQRRFDLLAHQSLSAEEKDACLKISENWKTDYQILHATLREANLQAKLNLQRAAKTERDLLLGGGEESTNRRRDTQTRAGMSAAAESVTESLRRTRQMMVQELERGHGTLATLDVSNTTLGKADAEYKGQRFLLNTTRNLLSALKRHDVMDRIILIMGFLVFAAVVMYIFNQRIGLLKLQRTAYNFYRGRSSHTTSPSESIDMHSGVGMDTDLSSGHSPIIESKEGSDFVCKELQGCVATASPGRDLENGGAVEHTEF